MFCFSFFLLNISAMFGRVYQRTLKIVQQHTINKQDSYNNYNKPLRAYVSITLLREDTMPSLFRPLL